MIPSTTLKYKGMPEEVQAKSNMITMPEKA
jgi:hypothetical protein